jgi:hypothetical protein
MFSNKSGCNAKLRNPPFGVRITKSDSICNIQFEYE